MKHTLALFACGWWILVRAWGGGVDAIPRAMGPYPSAEMCRIAAKDLMPSDRSFWTAEERALAEAAAKADRDEIAAVPHDGKLHTLKNGDQITVDKNGGVIHSGLSIYGGGTAIGGYGPMYQHLTGCVWIPRTKS